MKPLKVALVTRPGSIPGERNCGWFAYPVPEFEVRHYQVPKHAELSRVKFGEYDAIIWEDGKSSIRWGDDGPPLCYVVTDSTLSDEHYQKRLGHARHADLVLVDWDRLERFECTGKPVRRFSYCVNDRRFRDWGLPKDVDVAYHVNEDTPERQDLGDWLGDLCKQRGWVYARGVRLGDQYARAFNRARVTVNVNRTPTTRNHRLFDAMACRTCVLTDPVPEVSGEALWPGVHYVEWHSRAHLIDSLTWMFDVRWPKSIPDAAHDWVREHHTWAVRARELRATLAEVFPWLA